MPLGGSHKQLMLQESACTGIVKLLSVGTPIQAGYGHPFLNGTEHALEPFSCFIAVLDSGLSGWMCIKEASWVMPCEVVFSS